MSQKVIKVIFRFDSEAEDWLAVAKRYCTFLIGKDKRGRGYGSSPAELKAVEKEILRRFNSIEACRQWLAKSKTIVVVEGRQGFLVNVGCDKDSFQKVIEKAYRMTANWKNEENVVARFDNLAQAQRAIQGREGHIAGTYRLSDVHCLYL